MSNQSTPGRSAGDRARGSSFFLALASMMACGSIWLAGCATQQQFSFLDGERWSRVELNTFDTQIISVDDKYYSYNSRIMVDPGLHHIVFATPPLDGFKDSPRKTMELDVKPCMRYWFEAKRVNGLTQDFEPRVNYVEPIAGCGAGVGA